MTPEDRDALAKFIGRKGQHAPCVGFLLTRGPDPRAILDRWHDKDVQRRKPVELADEIVLAGERFLKTGKLAEVYVYVLREEHMRRGGKGEVDIIEGTPDECFCLQGDIDESMPLSAEVGQRSMQILARQSEELHRTLLETRVSADRSDREGKAFLFSNMQWFANEARAAREAHFRDMDAMRALALAEEERRDAQMARRRQEKLFEAVIRQVEVALPILGSYLMAKKGAKDYQENVDSLNLVLRFAKSLTDEQNTAFLGLLDAVQMVAFGEVAGGKVQPMLIPVTIGRALQGMTDEQRDTIMFKILAPAKDGKMSEQQAMFQEILKMGDSTLIAQVEKLTGVQLFGSGRALPEAK